MNRHNLESTAKAMVADGKGILAADETVGTKRLETLNIKSPEESRRTYRKMVLATLGASEFIRGVMHVRRDHSAKGFEGNPLS